jgi:hypothetical protein
MKLLDENDMTDIEEEDNCSPVIRVMKSLTSVLLMEGRKN